MRSWIRKRLGKRCQAFLELYYSARYVLLYKGERYVCPCCNAHLRRFLDMTSPLGRKMNSIICPRCDSHPRHRLLWLYLQEFRKEVFEKQLDFLHLAPEFCFERHFRTYKKLRYFTGDLCSAQVMAKMDVCNLPIVSSGLDVVFCNHVLEHVPDDRGALNEIYRVLRPGGWALMQVPIDYNRETTLEDPEIISPEEREHYYGQNDHLRLYGQDFTDLVESTGFCVEVIDYVSKFEPDRVNYFGLFPSEKIYFCQKAKVSSKI